MTTTIFNSGTTIDNQTITVSAGDTLIFGPLTDAMLLGTSDITGGGTFINEGTMAGFRDGVNPDVTIEDNFVNYGTISGLATLTVDAPLTNYGTISASFIYLNYDTTGANLESSVEGMAGNIFYSGTIDNTGYTFDYGPLVDAAIDGVILGGTVTGLSYAASSTWSDVTVLGNMVLGDDDSMTVLGTLGFALNSQIQLGESASIYFVGTQTLSGSILFQGDWSAPSGPGAFGVGGDALKIGTEAGVTIVNSGVFSGTSILNEGFIVADGQNGSAKLDTLELQTGTFGNAYIIQLSMTDFVLGNGGFANTGIILLDNSSTMTVGQNPVNLGFVDFVFGNSSIVDQATTESTTPALTGTLEGFSSGDALVFPQLDYSASDTVSVTSDVLTVADGTNTLARFDLVDSGAGTFTIGEEFPGGFGVEVGLSPCYCRGTSILTPSGEVLVENLRIGDRVTTQSGAARPVKWIGRRAYDGRFIAGNRDALPIRIRAGALAENVPHRDLLVSPHHALFLDGVLIPAEQLVNGVSIRQEEAVAQVAYFHVELDSHDVLVAEGAPAESFVDAESRLLFQNAGEFAALYPDAEPQLSCAKRATGGEALRRVWRRIARRAGIADAAPGALRGRLDVVQARHVEGWARSGDAAPVWVSVVIDGLPVARGLANRWRPDLNGWHGFHIVLPRALDAMRAHRVSVRREADGAELPGSPVTCRAAPEWPPMRRAG